MSKSVRIDDDVLDRITAEVPGKSLSDKLRALMERPTATGSDSPAVLETLELVRSIAGVMPRETIPDSEQIEMIVDVTMQRKIDERTANRPAGPSFAPASIPGVQQGAQNLRPRRESGTERAEREGRERQQRAVELDPVQDESIDRSDEFVSV